MKREHLSEEELPENLILYMPLSSAEDMIEVISGQEMQIVDNLAVFDTSKNAWKFTLPSSVGQRSAYVSGLNLGLRSSGQDTTCIYTYLDNNGNNFRCGFYGYDYSGSDTPPYQLFMSMGGSRIGINVWKKVYQMFDATNRKERTYFNDIQNRYISIDGSFAYDSICNSGVSIGYKAASSQSGSFWLKGIAVFNKLLTLEQTQEYCRILDI